eukprot:g1172.t1
MSLTYEDVDEILRLLDGAKADLTLQTGDFLLEVRRGGAAQTSRTADLKKATAPPIAEPAESQTEAASEASVAAGSGDGEILGAPMTGTFYRAPSPQDPPFVEEGQEVEAGATIGLIEVMKLFTTIEAPHAGRVVKVLAGNAEPVQADQPLFEIVPL